jgi:hypothetical protein
MKKILKDNLAQFIIGLGITLTVIFALVQIVLLFLNEN